MTIKGGLNGSLSKKMDIVPRIRTLTSNTRIISGTIKSHGKRIMRAVSSEHVRIVCTMASYKI